MQQGNKTGLCSFPSALHHVSRWNGKVPGRFKRRGPTKSIEELMHRPLKIGNLGNAGIGNRTQPRKEVCHVHNVGINNRPI